MYLFLKLAFLSSLAVFSVCCFAQEPKEHFEFIATVNGVPITKGLEELNLKQSVARGQKDTPQLRQAIKQELINRQLISQEVVKQGLDKEIDMQDQLTQLRQSLYLQAFIDNYLKTNPITNEKLKEEYERQKQYIGNGTDSATQYKISQIVLKTESEAIAVIGRLDNGDAFAKVAKEVSQDAATRGQGGDIGWASPGQLPTPIGDVLGTLSKGNFNKTPIKLSGAWVIVRVDDTRSAKIPSFEASQNQLKQAIVQQYLAETIKRLRESARIVQ